MASALCDETLETRCQATRSGSGLIDGEHVDPVEIGVGEQCSCTVDEPVGGGHNDGVRGQRCTQAAHDTQ